MAVLRAVSADQQTDPSVARAVVNAASDGTVALLSYSPESLDKDFATAKSHLSGDFLSYYNQFTDQIVAPAAKQKSLKTTARVLGAAVRSCIRIRPWFWCSSTRAPQARTGPTRRGGQHRAGECDPGQRQLADHQIRPGLSSGEQTQNRIKALVITRFCVCSRAGRGTPTCGGVPPARRA